MLQTFEKVKKFRHELILLALTLIYIAYFSAASIIKYNNYFAGRFDLGNMAQTVWNTAHGRLFMLTDPNGVEEVSRLSFHADFILALLSPFYFLWEDPRTLLFIQTLVLSLGGVFVYLIARELLKSKNLSLVFAFCYFLNPAVNYVNLFDFHPVSLATTFLLAAFYFILKKKYYITIVFLILAGLTKEEVWLINALFGLYLILIAKQRILGIITFITSAIIFYLLLFVLIPKAHGSAHFALAYYSDYGESPGEVIKNIIFSPIKTFQTLVSLDRLTYVKQIFMPLGYLSFLALPFLIFAAPDLGIDLLSSNASLHQIYYQYSSTITPFIFIAAIYGVYFLRRLLPEIPDIAFGLFLITCTLISAYSYGPLPYAKKPQNIMFNSPLENRKVVDSYLESISPSFSIAATNNLGSHLSHRRNIYVIPQGVEDADFVLYLLRNSNEAEKKSFWEVNSDHDYKLIFHDNTFYVFKRI